MILAGCLLSLDNESKLKLLRLFDDSKNNKGHKAIIINNETINYNLPN